MNNIIISFCSMWLFSVSQFVWVILSDFSSIFAGFPHIHCHWTVLLTLSYSIPQISSFFHSSHLGLNKSVRSEWKRDKIMKLSIFDEKTKIQNYGQNLDKKWQTDCKGADFVGLRCSSPLNIFYLGARPAMYLTIIRTKLLFHQF